MNMPTIDDGAIACLPIMKRMKMDFDILWLYSRLTFERNISSAVLYGGETAGVRNNVAISFLTLISCNRGNCGEKAFLPKL